MSIPRVILRPKRAQPFFARHPWIFPGAIASVDGTPVDGAEVDVFTSTGAFVARGFFNSHSKIRVRLYSWIADQPLDEAFLRERIASSMQFRKQYFGTTCRLISSEGDGLSGLVVDRYDRWLTVQFTALAMAQRRDVIAAILAELTGVEGMYTRTEKGIGKVEGLELQDEPLWGTVPSEPIVIDDGAMKYYVDLREGQKTGFFLDQRSNRAAVARYLANRDVLDAFCYSGGFALHAAKAGARKVEAVDVSEPALALARRNADLNEVANISFTRADVFDHLGECVKQKRTFGAIILDPPKFARTLSNVPEALNGYRVLINHALKLLPSDGILVMCCCSGVIAAEDVEALLAQSAAGAKRGLQLLERRGQAADHPINIACPQTSYLKCFICRVM